MTVNRGLFVKQIGNIGTTPLEGRQALAAMFAENSPGVPRQGLLEAASKNIVVGTNETGPMKYSVLPFKPVISRTLDEGVYLCSVTGSNLVPTDAAPGSGSRYDLIWFKQNDVEKGDSDNEAVLGVTVGTASPNPAKPTASVPSGALILAEALVQAGATTTVGASVTITQVWLHTALRGNPIPVRNTAERSAIVAVEGDQVHRLDLPGTFEFFHKGGWLSPRPSPIAANTDSFTASTGGYAPRVWSNDGITGHTTGAVRFTGTASSTLAKIGNSAYWPETEVYLGTVLASLNSGDTVNGAVIGLRLRANGEIFIGYQSKSIAATAIIPLMGTYPIKG